MKENVERIKPKYHIFGHEESPGINVHENITFINGQHGTEQITKDSSGAEKTLRPPIEFEIPILE